MKILLATHTFYPDIGGLETVARTLGEQFVAAGHEVILLTNSLARTDGDDTQFCFPVVRRPHAFRLLSLMRWCDVYFQNNVSLRTLWPLLIVHRPWVVSHQTWLTRVDGHTGWQDRLKKFLIRFGAPIAISRAVAVPLGVPVTIIGNPYQDHLFRRLPGVTRERDIVFLARLVSDKGGDLTLEALALLKQNGLTPSVTVIGDGPERGNLEKMTVDLGLTEQVTFAGMRTGEELVRLLNEHRIMVVPSRLAEPFGVVALEGIACGCALVGSESGGLADAIGPCGLTFPNHDAAALADRLFQLLTDKMLCAQLRSQGESHLAKHTGARIAQAYLEVFNRTL